MFLPIPQPALPPLLPPPPQDCTSPALYASLPDGAYQFAVRADVSDAPAAWPPVNACHSRWDGHVVQHCLPHARRSSPCSFVTVAATASLAFPSRLLLLPQGEEIASSRNFVLDTTPPQLAFLADSLASGTATPAATANISWEGSDATGVAYTCTLQGSGTVPLQPPVYSGTTKLEMQQVGGGGSGAQQPSLVSVRRFLWLCCPRPGAPPFICLHRPDRLPG